MRRLFDNYIRGTKNDDTLNGSNLKDEIVGLDGNDTINAKAGDDWVYGDDGEDIINGGAGNDKLWGNDDNDRVRGGSGHDEVYGDDGNDTLYGDNGNDEVYGGQGKDEAHGGKGDDYVWGNEGDDKVYGNDGNDEVYGDDGNDEVHGDKGNDGLYGGHGDDLVMGGAGDDYAWGNEGDDIVHGGSGHDGLYGDDGNDKLYGETGNDWALGGKGNDEVYGGDGNDYVWGNGGNDYVDGGDGNDEVYGDDGNDTVLGGAGNDWVLGGDGHDIADGGAGSDDVHTGDGDDQLMYSLAENAGQTDHYDGGKGCDRLCLSFTSDEWSQADIRADVAAFLAYLRDDAGKGDDDGFDFTAFNLSVYNIEKVKVLVDGTEIDLSNQAPGAVNDEATTDEDTQIVIDVLANDSDPDDQGLNILEANVDPAQGFVAIEDGKIVFNPAANFNGEASIAYTIQDADGQTDSATVSVTVNPVNDAPNAVKDQASTDKGEPVTIDVLANDTDPDGDALTIVKANVKKAQGSVEIVDGKLVFTPADDFTGTATIKYVVKDAGGLKDKANVKVQVKTVNDAPVAMDDTATTDENTKVVIDVLANDTDPDGDTLTIINPMVDAVQGTAIVEDGKIVFTPAADFSGEASIAYSVQDAGGLTDSATVTVTVNSVNDAPVAVDDTATTDEDTKVVIDVLANDSDPDGDDLTIINPMVDAAQGTVIVEDGKIVFTPAADFSGEANIAYTVQDAGGLTDSATVTVTVNPVNDAPVAVDDTATTDEDTKVIIDVLANDSDPDGDDLTIINPMVDAAQGTVIVEDGKIVFTPAADFNGEASIAYTVQDTDGLTDSATVKVTINPVNDAPDAVKDKVSTNENTQIIIDVLANDTDPDGDDLTIIEANVNEAKGSVEIVEGKIVFTPSANFSGKANIAYSVQDAGGLTDSATVRVKVKAVNDAPVAVDDTATTDENAKVIIDVLANDSDPDGDALTIVNPMVDAAQGTAIVEDGKIVFTPAADFSGEASIAYTVQDADGLTDSATVTVTVNPVNDAPDAVDDTATTDEDTKVVIDVLANDTDPDGDDLTIINPIVDAAQGTVIVEDGKIVFTPAADFSGEASIAYTVQDADGLTDSATVTVTVNPVNDAPVAMDDTATTDENTKVVIDVLANDSDPDGDDLTIINPTVDAAQGTAIVEDGKIVFTPAAGFSGEASIAYSVQDAGGLTDSATVTVTVNSVNTPPLVDGPLASETAEDEAAYEFDLLVGASDADGGTLLVDETSIKTDGEDGLADGFTLDGKMLTIDPANAAFQSLKAGETKDIVITYNILDGQGGSVSQTATITITGVNDAPTITGPLSYETSEDNGVYPLNLLETANDIDGDDLNIANLSGLEDGLVLDGNVLKIDPSNAAFQALAEGETKVIDLSYDIVDGQGGSVSQTAKITINGVNDDPVISGDFSGDVSEDDVVSASGVLSIADPDNGQSSFTPATDLAGTYGMLDIAADGSWTYTLDNDNPLVQALSAKDSVTDSITVTSVDGTEQVITLTLTGANDLPEIEGKAQKRTVDESSSAESPVTADGLFSVIDLDTVANASASVELIQLKGNGKNKFDRDALSDLDMLDLDLQPTDDPTKGALNWTFNSESDDGSIETFGALGANQTLKLVYKITVEHADDPSLNDSKNITITIKGAEGNAQPEIVPTVEEAEAETEDLAPDTNADAGDVVPVQALPSLADASFGPSAETEPAPQTLERDAASELFEGMSMDSSHLGEMIAMVNANSDLIERGSPLTGVKVSKEGNQAGDLHSIDAAVVDQLAEELALFHQESAEQDLMA